MQFGTKMHRLDVGVVVLWFCTEPIKSLNLKPQISRPGKSWKRPWSWRTPEKLVCVSKVCSVFYRWKKFVARHSTSVFISGSAKTLQRYS